MSAPAVIATAVSMIVNIDTASFGAHFSTYSASVTVTVIVIADSVLVTVDPALSWVIVVVNFCQHSPSPMTCTAATRRKVGVKMDMNIIVRSEGGVILGHADRGAGGSVVSKSEMCH